MRSGSAPTTTDSAHPGAGGALPSPAFRACMADVCTPVAVLTTMTDRGEPYGTTVSAVASLSLDPPMVMVALDHASTLLGHVRERRAFGVNVLAADQHMIARGFARSATDKFDGVPWHWDGGLPRLDGHAGCLACVVQQTVPGGDHTVLFGTVTTATSASTSASTRSLVYVGRTFQGGPDPS